MPEAGPSAPLHEIFASIQGEGLLSGVRQLFMRVRGCDLRCGYCDQPEALEVTGDCRVEYTAGSAQFERVPNPVGVERCRALIATCRERSGGVFHSIALTGGEPLLYPEFVTALASAVRADGLELYLETAGHRPGALEQVIEQVAWIAMDVKLPFALRRPIPLERFVRFLEIARQKPTMVKMVVAAQTPLEQIEQACALIATVDSAVPLIIQPVAPTAGGFAPPTAAALMQIQALCQHHLAHVRVMPQSHKPMGVL